MLTVKCYSALKQFDERKGRGKIDTNVYIIIKSMSLGKRV